jgi:hypothetical protein
MTFHSLSGLVQVTRQSHDSLSPLFGAELRDYHGEGLIRRFVSASNNESLARRWLKLLSERRKKRKKSRSLSDRGMEKYKKSRIITTSIMFTHSRHKRSRHKVHAILIVIVSVKS